MFRSCSGIHRTYLLEAKAETQVDSRNGTADHGQIVWESLQVSGEQVSKLKDVRMFREPR